MRPGCYDVHERVRDMSAGGQLAGLNFPNWTGFSGQVLNAGSRPRRQPRDDQGLQRLARRRVVRRVSRSLHPVRHPAAVRRRTRRRRRCTGSRPRAATRSRSPRTPPASACRASTPATWDPLFAACCDDGHRAVLSRRLVVEVGVDRRPTRRAPVPMNLSSVMAIYTLGDLLWADFWHRFPDAALRADRGRHRLDPVLPPAGRAHARPAQRVDAPRAAAGAVADRAVPRAHPVLLHQRPRRREAARRVQRRQRVLGVRLPALRQLVAGRARAAAPTLFAGLDADVDRPDHAPQRDARTTSSTRSRTRPPRALHGRARCGPRPATSTP